MKIVCTKKYHSQGLQHELTYGKVYGLTIGKIYDAVQKSRSGPNIVFEIVDDDGYITWHDEVLMDLSKWRKIRLNDLGI